jgi:uncharacterized Zn finger protein
MSWYAYKPYVPVASHRAQAKHSLQKLRKKGEKIQPIEINGRIIAHTFWGKAWCDHLETFSDYENRLPRGRTYVRNGSVCHLEIKQGTIQAIVSGSELYHINISIKKFPEKNWQAIKKQCAGKIGSLLELLQGKLSSAVMAVVTDTKNGLFPSTRDIQLDCDCPDWAALCKHLAAVLYGIGARLDEAPELLFLLRGLDHSELIETGIDMSLTQDPGTTRPHLDSHELSGIFGIEMDTTTSSPKKIKNPQKKRSEVTISKTGGKSYPKTGTAVAKLRRKFAMTETEFASLLGVSRHTIRNWEKQPGTLSLRQQNDDALKAAARLSKQQGWRKLENE